MSAAILDGKKIASQIKAQLKVEVECVKKLTGEIPHICNVMVGTPPSAGTYSGAQRRLAEELGISYELKELAASASQNDLIALLGVLNKDSRVNGILVYKPLPDGFDYQAVSNQIFVEKDIEGVTLANIGKLFLGETAQAPCTAEAAFELIKTTGVPLRGKEAVVIGVSEIVGKPLISLLMRERATVTVCHRGTKESGMLSAHVGRADILVAAIGQPEFIPGEWIKKGAIVIDVGINHVDNKIVGDVAFEAAKARAAFITPVPGGVGPVTTVMLMRNALKAFRRQKNI